MAEKKVNVRLAAVGGKLVKAEFEGIGNAAKRGFGKASREVELANAKLAKFARRAKIATGIMAAAAISAGVSMVRSSLQTIDAQAKLAASLGTTTASIQVLARAADLAGVSQGEVEQATIMMTKSLSQAAQGTGPAVKALQQLHLSAQDLAKLPIDQKLVKIQDAIKKYIPAAQRAAVASQIFGARAGLIFSRIDSAAIRQAKKDVKDFGVETSKVDAAQVQRTNDALSRMGLLWKGISNQLAVAAAPALEAVANAMAAFGKTTGPLGRAIKGLFNHIGELATIAATFAGVMGVRFVASLAAAALGVGKLALSMRVLKGAIIRTGIGALIVGAGELIYWFGQLVKGTGGFGNALGLLKDLAVEVWDRIKSGAVALGARMTAVFFDLKADAASGMQSAIRSVISFGNKAANTFEGAFNAIKAVWGKLPAAIGDLVFQAANSLVKGIEHMINGAIDRLNWFGRKINDFFKFIKSPRRVGLFDHISIGSIDNPFAGKASAAGKAAAEAFRQAFRDNPLKMPDTGLDKIAQKALETANMYRQAGSDIGKGVLAPLKSWKALGDAITSAADLGKSAIADTGTAAAGLAQKLAGSGKSVAGAAAKAANSLKDSLGGAFRDLVKGTRSLGDALSGVLNKLADMAINSAFEALWKGGLGNAVTGIFGGLFANANGNVFAHGLIQPFATGGVVSSPTLFPMRGSTGLMGEAGPEAIMPLTRVGGKLGVRAAGGGLQRVELIVRAEEGRMFRPTVERVSHDTAVRVTQQGLDTYDRHFLPGRIDQIARDPRARG